MVRFLFLVWEDPENNGSFPLVYRVSENYGASGAADEWNWLYYKMWGSSTAYRGGVGCLFFFFAKRILQMKKYFGTFFSRLFSKVFARLGHRYYNRFQDPEKGKKIYGRCLMGKKNQLPEEKAGQRRLFMR